MAELRTVGKPALNVLVIRHSFDKLVRNMSQVYFNPLFIPSLFISYFQAWPYLFNNRSQRLPNDIKYPPVFS